LNPSANYPLPQGFTISIYNSIEESGMEVLQGSSVFFQPAYFKALENAEFAGFSFFYGKIYKGERLAGLIYFQLIDLSFVKIGSVIHTEPYGKFMKLVSEKITRSLLGNKGDRKHFLLVNGNMCVSGNFGIHMLDEFNSVLPAIYDKILEAAEATVSKFGELSVTIVKDFHFNADVLSKILTSRNFIRFIMDPVMTLGMEPHWNNFEDYLSSLSSKYRLRAVTVMERLDGMELRELDVNELELHIERMEFLYHSVVNKSPIRIIQPDMNYLIQLKKYMKEVFIVKAWFKDNQPVAFFTAFNFNGVTEAHHIGMDYQLNKANSFYQNILYGLIQVAIDNKSKFLDYGRTAMEMKSTVGALPENYAAYIKINNRVLNHLIKPFLPSAPPSDWVQRDPFKKNGNA
jgi:hypothetical protein